MPSGLWPAGFDDGGAVPVLLGSPVRRVADGLGHDVAGFPSAG
jgi:hypothetical protein